MTNKRTHYINSQKLKYKNNLTQKQNSQHITDKNKSQHGNQSSLNVSLTCIDTMKVGSMDHPPKLQDHAPGNQKHILGEWSILPLILPTFTVSTNSWSESKCQKRN